MPKKVSVRGTAKAFDKQVDELLAFTAAVQSNGHSDAHVSLAYEAAIIKLYAAFEDFIGRSIVGAINNDPTATISRVSGVSFPRHLTDKACEYLVIGDGYFDFRGRSGLIQILKQFLPAPPKPKPPAQPIPPHYLIEVVSQPKYKDDLDRLCALRNHAAHGSSKSRAAALSALKLRRMGSAGSWLKRQQRFDSLCTKLKALSGEIATRAPY